VALQNGLTALLWAADLGHLEVVQLLLKMKADIQAVDAVSSPSFATVKRTHCC
jgi:ankyrin repeat protein